MEMKHNYSEPQIKIVAFRTGRQILSVSDVDSNGVSTEQVGMGTEEDAGNYFN